MKTISNKIILALFAFFVFCCTPTEETPIDQTPEEIAELIGNGNVTSYRMSDDGMSMTITFENGQTATITFPESVFGTDGIDGADGTNGSDGANGTDGTGIESIEFDDETGELVITMSNDVVYRFDFTIKDGEIDNSKLVDVDGMYFFKSLQLGAFEMASFEYTDDFQIESATINDVENGDVIPVSTLKHTFENGKISYTESMEYATRQEVYYDWNYYFDGLYSYDYTVGDVFESSARTNTYSSGIFSVPGLQIVHNTETEALELLDENDEGFGFYLNGIDFEDILISEATPADFSSDTYLPNKIEKKSDTEIYEYIPLVESDGQLYYILYTTYTNILQVEKGDVLSSGYLYREYDGENLSKMYATDEQGGDYDEYIQMSYTGGNLSKAEEYYKDGGQFVKSDGELIYNYDANGKLTSTVAKSGDSEGDTLFKVLYDSDLNPIEIWSYHDAVFEYGSFFNDETGRVEYDYHMVKEAGFRPSLRMEYYDNMKNFFGHSINAMLPELEQLELTKAPKRVFSMEDNSSIRFEYKDFNKGGYPESVQLLMSDGGEYLMYEGIMDYTVKR
ncbi:hypothetical protein [Flammeovirga sp. OC4]|uniref:hypothetical protein n=1 Tax=Flammeovirga sp. OC4 TaxID=1382345 RepID=UPI0005C65635|nr:hypothetical protein [Flammeovirga sp. OC4]